VIPFFQPNPSDAFSPGEIFTFRFVMIGPLEIIRPFARMASTPCLVYPP